MRLYNAAIKDSAFGYALFFAFYMAHMIFVGWSAVGKRFLELIGSGNPVHIGHSGLLPCI
jgi:hypothetical protein